MKQEEPVAIQIPTGHPHGLLIVNLSRHRHTLPSFRHPYDGAVTEVERARLGMYAEAQIDTPNFEGRVQITLTPSEVKAFNRVEAQVAARLSREVTTRTK